MNTDFLSNLIIIIAGCIIGFKFFNMCDDIHSIKEIMKNKKED